MNNDLLNGDILIVDDTPANLHLLMELLAANSFKVRPATSGELALKAAFLTPPEVILLDIRMPGMDGYEVCRRLKAEPKTKEIPVIFLSAMNELQDRLRGFEVGAVDYISKPFEREEVLLRVRTHLELHRMRASLKAMVAARTRELSTTVRALKTLSGVNQALIHAFDESELFQRICRAVHDIGGFPIVWIGFLQEGSEAAFQVMAQLGAEPALIERLALAGAGTPTAAAIAGSAPVQCPDIAASTVFGELSAELSARGCRSAIALPLCQESTVYGAITLFSEQPGPVEGDALALLSELAADLAFGIGHLRTQAARRMAEQERLRQAEQLSKSLAQTVQAIALTVEKRDPYTAGHQLRVAELAAAIGREMGLTEQQTLGVRMSAMIHDLGKISVPVEILTRPGRLSEAEWHIIQGHPRIGHDIIQGVEFPWPGPRIPVVEPLSRSWTAGHHRLPCVPA